MRFGLLSFIVALVAVPIPVVGIPIGWLALLFAAIAAWRGERVLPAAVVLISILNYIFLSPSLWLSALTPVDTSLIEITLGMVILPMVVMIMRIFVKH